MERADAALVGGTGIGRRLTQMAGKQILVPTPFGPFRGRLFEHQGVRIVAVQRHSMGHRTPPHLVNYRAVADGLARMGVRACLSSAAVGSLRADWTPGTLAVVTDFLDFTGRRLTRFDREFAHVDFSRPLPAGKALVEEAEKLGHIVEPQAVYAATDGPRYESPAEIRMLQHVGADVVGMTATTEAVLMRESGVDYGCLAAVTNLACGLEDDVLAHTGVEAVMKRLQQPVLDLLLGAIVRAVS
ncbi:MAG: MTAP family purine nucleoside phosphorylase [Fimbriimonadaceae bacterium]|nr:MTAP family purine nucleoside phosphorylase [Fimbriimonadaceae bacterium]QYK54675.1 MAG: MTAP family purine nucleoside phosphorylase [Fimbriimonadaceae bacterium]